MDADKNKNHEVSFEQEVSNWTHFWIRKLSGNANEFLLPATGKPTHDLVEPGWLQESPPPSNAIFNYLVPNKDGVAIVSLMNNPCLHGSWLASWPVFGQGEIDHGRALWHPVGLRLAVDFGQRALILQQEWSNPRFVSNILLGVWAPDAPDWISIEFAAKHKLTFNLLLPADRRSFDLLASGSRITFAEDTPLLLTRWRIHQIVFRGDDSAPANIDYSVSGTVH